jgi:hypothetical protein
MFTRPSVSGERKAANLCKSTLQLLKKKKNKKSLSHIERERERDLIRIIYHANILPTWQNVSNQIKQVLTRNAYILKPVIEVKSKK